MLTSTRAGQPHNTDAIALPPGGHPNTIVVADDTTIVEHRGNAGRPHAAANQPSRTPGQRRSSPLRCKTNTLTDTNPNTTNPNPHAPKNLSTRTPQTGNAGSVTFAIVADRRFDETPHRLTPARIFGSSFARVGTPATCAERQTGAQLRVAR
jgi:hypothetical protein